MARCKICRDKFEPRFFLQKACFDPACLDAWSKLDKLNKTPVAKKVKAIEFKAQRKKDKYRLKELMSRGKWFIRLQILVNQWVVHVRDKDKPCYTCGTSNPNIKYDCGHRHHAGRGGGDRRRFILENLHKQCSVQCNQHGGGMPVEYDIALNIEYGDGFADELKCVVNYPELKDQFPTWQDIEAEIIRYRKLLRAEGLTPISRG